MKTLTILATAAALVAPLPLALAQTGQMPAAGAAAAEPAKTDSATFVTTAASANAFEIQSSALAVKNDVAGDVKEFAALMIKDHTAAGEALKSALTKVDATSATQQGLLADDQAKLDLLASLHGAAFQTAYISAQAEAHKAAVALFSNYAQTGDDPALKEFAKKSLPMLQMHEKRVKELQAAHPG